MHKKQSKEKADKEKLIHKLKQERKGALREIRKDKDFLGTVKIQQKVKRYVSSHFRFQINILSLENLQNQMLLLNFFHITCLPLSTE